ncbi:MAG: hypothetical protein BWY31_01840 [Lentisphaerae bacterium ADurb.Bin242]|nr:MAG: hypothetical protein BWY31_01840 [Lentisphaerae bacterium ADurb.Bin242]
MSLLDQIEQLKQSTSVETAAALDSQGFLATPGESAEAYAERLLKEEEKIRAFREKLSREKVMEPYKGLIIDSYSEISPEILEEAAETTRKAYGFEVKWVPGFFPVQGLGLLWGGCSIGAYENLPALFIIRRNFQNRKRFFIYSREELTSHELCHVARSPLNDIPYEEHFAYALSRSALRRYSGNCFKSEKDALLFLLPMFLLLAVQIGRAAYWPWIPVWPFWILAFVWPVYLVVSNQFARKRYFRAEKALAPYTDMPGAVLFRCVAKEIDELADCSENPEAVKTWLESKKDSDLRWKIIFHRFLNQKEA